MGTALSFLHLFGQVGDLASQWTGTSSVLGAQRMLEIATGDWVCPSDALTGDAGWSARFDLRAGFAETLAWYREEGLVP